MAITRPRLVCTILLLVLMTACAGARRVSSFPKFENLTGAAVGGLRFSDADGAIRTLDQPLKLYLIDFMAIGCKPCMEELPELLRLQRSLARSEKFELVLVVYGWDGPSLRQWAKDLDVGDVPLFADTAGAGSRLKVMAWPTKFLIRNGRVLEHQIGGGAGAYERWRSSVSRRLR